MTSARVLSIYHRIIITTVLSLFMTGLCWGEPRYTVTYRIDSGPISGYFNVGSQDEFVATGGHPNGYMHAVIDTAEPQVTSTPLHPYYHLWLGDYTYSQIINLGVDINVFSAGIAAENRPVSLALRNNGHTPDDPSDDCEVNLVGGKHVPRPGRGWKAFDFNVPFRSLVLPNGWVVLEGTCKDLTPDEAWLRVIHDVTELSYVLGDPGASYDVETWDIGFDNPRLTIDRGGILPFAGPPSVDIDVP